MRHLQQVSKHGAHPRYATNDKVDEFAALRVQFVFIGKLKKLNKTGDCTQGRLQIMANSVGKVHQVFVGAFQLSDPAAQFGLSPFKLFVALL